METYVDTLDADEQITAEEDIAFYLFDAGNGGAGDACIPEETATHLSREILKIVLRRFRPDLFKAEV